MKEETERAFISPNRLTARAYSVEPFISAALAFFMRLVVSEREAKTEFQTPPPS
jgi:hypothetical protein